MNRREFNKWLAATSAGLLALPAILKESGPDAGFLTPPKDVKSIPKSHVVTGVVREWSEDGSVWHACPPSATDTVSMRLRRTAGTVQCRVQWEA